VKINHEVAKENFDKLLDWLSHDRDEAGARFEQIRDGLIRYFRLKGCHEPESLADESMNRVIKRIDELDLMTGVSPATLFYGFANKVFLEYYRSDKKRTVQLSEAFEHVSIGAAHVTADFAVDCLRECLNDLNMLDGKLIVDYYSKEKQAKFEIRRKMALQNDIAMGALHTRIHRIKGVLRPCVENCMNKKRL
jgi:DNA-directed RNA polymerase specialized sigma24 family protein